MPLSAADRRLAAAAIRLLSDALPDGRLPPPGPVEVASLLLGASMALMLCGSVTFLIGFMLMPWVVGMIVMLYFVGWVYSISGLGRAILFSVWNSERPEDRISTPKKASCCSGSM